MNTRIRLSLIMAITLLAFGLRVGLLEQRTLTIDEMSSLKTIANRDLLEIATAYHTNTHLLTALLAHLADYLGHWKTFYRGPVAMFGILTVPLLYQLGRRLLDEWTALLAALLLAVAPFHVDFSLQMRGYTAVAFWATVLYFCLWKGLATGKTRYWLGAALGGVLAVYAHLFGALAVGASWTIVGGQYLAERWRKHTSPWLRPAALSLLLTVLGLAILYGPLIGRIIATPEVETEWETQIEPLFVDGGLNGAALDDYLKVLRLYGPIGEPRSWLVYSFVILAAVGLGSMLLGASKWGERGRRAGFYSLAWLLLPLLGAALGLQFIPGFYVYRRFFIFFQPLYLLALAAGMVSLSLVVTRLSGRGWLGRLILTGLVLVALGSAAWKLYDQTIEDIDNQWQTVAATILRHGSNPLVICEPQGQRLAEQAQHRDECYRNLSFYFQDGLGQEVPWLQREIDQVATIPGVQALPQLETQAGDVWLVLWQRNWPAEWPGWQASPRLPGFNYYPVGSTLLIQSPGETVQLLALARSVDPLLLIDTTPEDRFSYYLSQAQMKAVIGERTAARAALTAAAALSPEGLDAASRLRAVAELIGMPLENRP